MLRRVLFLAVLFLAVQPAAAGQQIVAGAGPSTRIVETFFEAFCLDQGCADWTFTVMETSVKHAGGIKNSDLYLFGRTGRPLKESEKALGKEEIFLGRVPIAFAAGLETGLEKLSLDQVRAIFTGEAKSWREVGGADASILLAGREETEALFTVLREELPFFRDVVFDRIFKRDHELVEFLRSPAGRHAIGFGARPNFGTANLLEVSGFDAGVKVGLVYDLRNESQPIVQAVKQYASSSEWKRIVAEETDYLPMR